MKLGRSLVILITNKVSTEIEYSFNEIEKGKFPHFTLKEIHDQVNTITDTMRGRIRLDYGTAHLGGINDYLDRIQQAERIYITACGTSWHAGLIGQIYFGRIYWDSCSRRICI